MQYTTKLGLPIFNDPSTDKFKIDLWNQGNKNIEKAVTKIENDNVDINNKFTKIEIDNTNIKQSIGNIKDLNTSNKDNLVMSINEVMAKVEIIGPGGGGSGEGPGMAIVNEVIEARQGKRNLLENIQGIKNNINSNTTEITGIKNNINSNTTEITGIKNNINNFKKIILNVMDFGAKADANYYNSADSKYYSDSNFTVLANDDSQAIQTAIDYLLNNGGGTLYFPNGFYLVSNTIYINPNFAYIPIKIEGAAPIQSVYHNIYGKKNICGTRIICDSSIIFSVNRNSQGNQNNGGAYAWFEGFSCENIGFIGVKIGENLYKSSIAFEILGTRFCIENCGVFGIDTFINEPLTDNKGQDNYCDFCTIRNIHLKQMQKKCIRVVRADVSEISNIYNEEPTISFKNVIEVVGSANLNIKNVSSSMNVKKFNQEPLFESAVILLKMCNGVILESIFNTKNINFQAFIIIHNSNNVNITNVIENGLDQSEVTNMFIIKSSKYVNINGIYSVANRGKNFDFLIDWGEKKYKSIISVYNYSFKDVPVNGDETTKEQRLIKIKGAQYTDNINLGDLKYIKCIVAGNSYNIVDQDNRDLTGLFGKPVYSTDKSYFQYFTQEGIKNPIFHMKFIPKKVYENDILGYEPLFYKETVEEKILYFFNGTNKVTTLDNKCNFILYQV